LYFFVGMFRIIVIVYTD